MPNGSTGKVGSYLFMKYDVFRQNEKKIFGIESIIFNKVNDCGSIEPQSRYLKKREFSRELVILFADITIYNSTII